MFNLENLLKMAGVPQESLQQLMAVKQHLDKLPKEKQVEVMGRFIDDLKACVEEVEIAKGE